MKWKYRHTVLATCSAAFAFYHAGRQILPPALPLIKDQFGLNYAQAGFVASAYDIGYGLTLIAGGFMADRMKKGRLVVAGLVLLATSLMLTTLSNTFLSMSAVRILTGASFGAYFVAGISLVSSYFPKEERGKALGIHTGMGAGSGKLIAPLVAALVLPSLGWRPVFYLVGIPVLLIAIIFWRTVREPETDTTTIASVSTIVGKVFCNRFLIMLGLCNALIIAASVSLYSFLPLYLVKEMGADLAVGGYAVAFLNGIDIPIVPVMGTLSDKLGRKVVIFAMSVCSAIALYLFPFFTGGVEIVVGIVLLGIFVGTAFPLIITYVVDATPSSCRSVALGYVNTFTIVGGSVATILSGYISDAFGVRQVFPFLAALSVLATLVIALLAEPEKAQVAEQSAL